MHHWQIIAQTEELPTTPMDVAILLLGGVILAKWAWRTRFGKNALSDSPLRRNNMPFYIPFLVLILYFIVVGLAVALVIRFFPDLTDLQEALINNVIFCVGSVAGIIIILQIARSYFARRLHGFGLNAKNIGRDFIMAIIYLLAVSPLLLLVMAATEEIGQFVFGPEFQMEKHQQLEFLTEYSNTSLWVLIFVAAVLVVPVFEEMLFRGLLQTKVKSYIISPWGAVIITSVVFAIMHPIPQHWPTLFILALCLGYAYEKSGSLLRPIFIHVLFNASSVIFTMLYTIRNSGGTG